MPEAGNDLDATAQVIKRLEADSDAVCYIVGMSPDLDVNLGKASKDEFTTLARASAEVMLERLNQLQGAATTREIENPERRYHFCIISAARARHLNELMQGGIDASIELNKKYNGKFDKCKSRDPAAVWNDFDELMREQAEKVTPWRNAYKGLEPVDVGHFTDEARKYKIGDIVAAKDLATKKITLYDREIINFMRQLKAL